jgi:phage shock protein A
MFEDWKRAWRQAVDNFQREMQAGDEQAPPSVRAMERELVSASGALGKLDDEIRRTRRELDAERESEAVCRRRETLARNAGDEETTRIAVEFAARHSERAEVLGRKLAVLEDERSLLQRDLGDMRRMVSDATATQGTGTGTAGTASAGSAGSGAGGTAGPNDPLYDEQAAARDRAFSRLEQEARERAAAERLEELKRRMQG